MTRENQIALSGVILGLLSRSLRVCNKLDQRVRDEFEKLGDGFSFSVCVSNTGPYIKLLVANDLLVPLYDDRHDADVVIKFKDITGAFPVLTGRTGIAESFSQHRMQVFGSVSDAVALVRAIEITEAYLFPRFLLKKSMRRVPRKRFPCIAVYAGSLFERYPSPKICAEGPVLTEEISHDS